MTPACVGFVKRLTLPKVEWTASPISVRSLATFGGEDADIWRGCFRCFFRCPPPFDFDALPLLPCGLGSFGLGGCGSSSQHRSRSQLEGILMNRGSRRCILAFAYCAAA